jgi:phosphatidylinositol alpha-1,6-mannosyltransferase
MRKILLLTEIFPPVHGGSGRWFWEIYRRFPQGSVEVLTDDLQNVSLTDERFPHPIHRTRMAKDRFGVASLAGLQYYFHIWKKLDLLVRTRGIQQVHCGRLIPEGVPALLNKFRRGVPFTCYVHGEDVEIARTSREISMLTRWVLPRAEKIVANSNNTRDLLTRWWKIDEDRIVVMTPGVDIEHFHPSHSKKRRESWCQKKVIVTVGRLVPRKGQDMMIRALPLIRESVKDAYYCIVGGGAEEQYLRDLADSHGVSDIVEFAGELTDDQMLACYQDCDLFALPNRRVMNDDEGFGMVLLEAQSCGKAVLAGDSGGTRETMLLGETGVIADCTTPQSLAKSVVNLLQDTARLQQMGLNGRQFMERSFSWTELAQKAMERLK